MPPLNPCRRMRCRRRPIHIISDAESANSADSVQALLKGYKAAIRGTVGSPSVIRAPRIVLRLGWSIEHSHRSDETEHKQDKSHQSPSQSGIADGSTIKISALRILLFQSTHLLPFPPPTPHPPSL